MDNIWLEYWNQRVEFVSTDGYFYIKVFNQLGKDKEWTLSMDNVQGFSNVQFSWNSSRVSMDIVQTFH